MNFIHRIGLSGTKEVMDILRSLKIEFKPPDNPLVSSIVFDIDESHPGWLKLQPLLLQWDAFDAVYTEFTPSERDNAKYLQLSSNWMNGYPEPDDGENGYRKATYDLKLFCETCGIKKVQNAPFRMKNEPKWKKKLLLQLNWVYDVFFVQPEAWKEVFEPFGVGYLPVIHHKTGKELQTVVQLDIKTTAKSFLQMKKEYSIEICETCGKEKYNAIRSGFFPKFITDPEVAICRTQEFFGSGGSAYNAVIINQELRQAIMHHKLSKGLFVPMEN